MISFHREDSKSLSLCAVSNFFDDEYSILYISSADKFILYWTLWLQWSVITWSINNHIYCYSDWKYVFSCIQCFFLNMRKLLTFIRLPRGLEQIINPLLLLSVYLLLLNILQMCYIAHFTLKIQQKQLVNSF